MLALSLNWNIGHELVYPIRRLAPTGGGQERGGEEGGQEGAGGEVVRLTRRILHKDGRLVRQSAQYHAFLVALDEPGAAAAAGVRLEAAAREGQ